MKDNKDLPDMNEEPLVPPGLGELVADKNKQTKLLRIAIMILLVLFGAAFGFALTKNSQERRIIELQRQNSFLKAKLELYSATVDSIYNMLDSLQIKADISKDYPYAGGGDAKHLNVTLDAGLQQRLHHTDERLVSILQGLDAKKQDDDYQSFIIPESMENVPGIYPTFGRISDTWGTRIHPITGQLEFHQGIDIANAAGTPIYATASGKVIRSDYDSGYGKRITIDHGNGYRSLYAHLYNPLVQEGDTVEKGQIIALMGSTGLSTGPHLHYEVQYQEGKLNPANYLNRIEAYAFR
ncbi:MAG: M23 family metallopeptidase [Candidatus Cloacimonetes bacterium]|jgi:murein DD-endopeptidase MepM/ murein hydrolase activator NlpD|nr:M23 family metallopeptidase [Candidatus Cloacimonadota bacterium]